ncbi:DUF6308 family protein [Janibacter sp. Y6]|uniref:DUF6308 family protein n=1 Tax=Janibacter sp. Y6 TaxID=2913552 RepID=UPI0034A271DD
MTSLEPITVTPHLHEDQRAGAVALLQGYFAGLLDKGRGFEGGWWDTFDPSGTRSSSQDRFTADDVLSASLLSADIHPTARPDPFHLCGPLECTARRSGSGS